MQIYGDYHTHTTLSHGSGTIIENVNRAQELGLKQIAITDHGIGHIIYGLNESKIARARQEIDEIQDKYDIDILLGCECNLVGHSGKIDLPKAGMRDLDILLAGYHYIAKVDKLRDLFGLYRYAWLPFMQNNHSKEICTEAYINAVKINPIDVLTHINKCITIDCKAVAEVCAEYGTYIELSSRHFVLSDDDIAGMLGTKVKFIINSDAHKVDDIANVNLALDMVEKYNIPDDRVVNLGVNKPEFRSRG